MKFGPASPADALGGVTVHTLRQGPLVLKKGTTIGLAEVAALNKAGVKEVVVVRLEDGDVSEDVAAADVAKAVAGDGVTVERAFTGRANLFAARPGVLVIDRAAVDRINNIDEAITFATLPAYKPVVEGEMIATVKLIPFGVEAKLRDAAVAAAQPAKPMDNTDFDLVWRKKMVAALVTDALREIRGDDMRARRRQIARQELLPML